MTITISAFLKFEEKEVARICQNDHVLCPKGDWTQNMIFFITCIHVKWVVSKKFSFPSSVIRGVVISILVGPPPTIIISLSLEFDPCICSETKN